MKKTLLFAFTILLTLGGLSACKGGKEEKAVPVVEVSVTPASLALTEGETASLRAAVLPSDATEYTLTWSSSDAGVATISQDGIVAAIKAGSATITASAGGKSGTCSIVVAAKVIPVEKIELDQTELSLEEGETADLIATVAPSDATDPTVTWSTSDPEVATVSGQGKVTALKAGSAIITARAGDKTARCGVTVNPKFIHVESISLDITELSIFEGRGVSLTVTVLPANATDPSIKWYSSDEKIATVNQKGDVEAIKEGEVAIIVESIDGNKAATCKLSVVDPTRRIYYRTTDNSPIPFNNSSIGEIVSNVYKDGLGCIEFSKMITKIGDDAFANYSTLLSIELPDCVTRVNERAFKACSQLESISLPGNLTFAGAEAFSGCKSLLSFGSDQTSDDKRCLIITTQLVAFAPAGIKQYSVPTMVTAIAASAFRSCPELTGIIVPESVASIGNNAFAGCPDLTTIHVYRETPPELENADAFSGLPSDYIIYVPADVVDDYKAADGWKDVKEHIRALQLEPNSSRLF